MQLFLFHIIPITIIQLGRLNRHVEGQVMWTDFISMVDPDAVPDPSKQIDDGDVVSIEPVQPNLC